MSGPGRTCLGCRRVRPKETLIRLVRRADGVVMVDARGRSVGRGAYVCPALPCVEQGLERARLGRAFRKPCEVGPELAEEVRGAWRRR